MRLLLLLAIVCFNRAAAGNVAAAGSETNSVGEARFLSNIRQLTFQGRRSGEGYFSADGKALILQSEREPDNPFYQIYILDFESGDTHRVSPGMGKTTCAFFRPRSDEILFASTHLDPAAKAKQRAEFDLRASGKERRYSWDYDEHFDIFVGRRDGSQLRRLTSATGYDAEASYSPDGRKIVFTSLRDAYPPSKLSPADRPRLETDPGYFGEIYLMNADGSGQKRLTFTPGYDGGPFFSPDGKRILWRRFDTNGANADVYTMKLDGSDTRRLTDFGCLSWAPYYHPSGQSIVFTANKLGFGNFELFVVDSTGEREPVRVTFTEGFDGLPVFSPNGRKLCWTSNRSPDGTSQLFLADWNQEAALAALKTSPRRGGLPNAPATTSEPQINVSGARDRVPAARAASYAPEVRAEDLRREVSYLASEALEGRLTGTTGSQRASEFIADQLRRAGLKPLGEAGTYFQPFEFTSGVRVVENENRLAISTGPGLPPAAFEIEKDFRPLSFTSNGEFEGDVVFAGYGLKVPGKTGEGVDSYAGLDVTNKIVLALRYVPEDVPPQRRQELNRYAALRYKAMLAREHGAKAILIVTAPNSPNPGALVPPSSDGSLSGSDILAVSISTNVAEALLAGSGRDLKSLQTALDSENPHAEGGFPIPKLKLRIATAVERVKKTDRNVVGYLPPSGPANAAVQFVMLGAHYDHLGHGESASSRESKEEQGKIHPGADDNASGVAAVLELAAHLGEQRRLRPGNFPRGVLFAFWSGEELGLLGSSHFAEHPTLNLSNVVAYLNFDMVGRLRENKLYLQGIGSSTLWRRLIEKRNIAAGFSLALQDDPYLPTDTTALYPKQVPVLNFFTGSHDDYHRPTDAADQLNYDGLERIARFAGLILQDLAKEASRPDYVKVERGSSAGAGSRDNLRAYLGTVPDYSTEVKGVKLSGVRAGSPAERAGLKGGDVIVELGGQKIANIYDYTYALDAVRIGQPVDMVVLRDGKSMTLKVTPEARK